MSRSLDPPLLRALVLARHRLVLDKRRENAGKMRRVYEAALRGRPFPRACAA